MHVLGICTVDLQRIRSSNTCRNRCHLCGT